MKIVITPFKCYTESYTPMEHRIIYNTLLFYNENVDYINKQSGGSWDGYSSKYELNMSQGTFLTGFLEMVLKQLNEKGVFYELDDRRKFVEPYIDVGSVLFKLRPYQQDIIDKVCVQANGFIKSSCGSGKTITSLALFAKLKVKTLVVVNRIMLMNQSYKSYSELMPDVKVGKIGGGNCVLDGDITIAVVNTISGKLKKKDAAMIEFIKGIECVVVDEADLGTSASYQSILSLCPAAMRYGMSATPGLRNEDSNLTLIGLYSEIRVETFADELQKAGHLSPVYAKFIDADFPDNHKLRNIRSKTEMKERLIIYNGYRNSLICDTANKLIGVGEKPVIIFKYRHHGDEIAETMKEEFPHIRFDIMDGETPAKKREKMVKRYVDGEIDCLISSYIFAVGVSVDCLNYLIFAAGGDEKPTFVQIAGRLSRTNELDPNKVGIMIDFNDNTNFDLQQDSQTRKENFESEPGYKVLK